MRCSFCGTPRHKVKKLLAAGPRRAICDECVTTAAEVIADPDLTMVSEADFLGNLPVPVGAPFIQ